MWKKAFVLVVLSLLLLLLCACSGKENAIVGEWHFVEDESSVAHVEGTDRLNQSKYLSFRSSTAFYIYSDGTWVVEYNDNVKKYGGGDTKQSGTYSIVNDGTAISFVLITEGNARIDSIAFSISGSRLVLTQKGKNLVFTK